MGLREFPINKRELVDVGKAAFRQPRRLAEGSETLKHSRIPHAIHGSRDLAVVVREESF